MGCCGGKEKPVSTAAKPPNPAKGPQVASKNDLSPTLSQGVVKNDRIEIGENLEVLFFPDEKLPGRVGEEGGEMGETSLGKVFELICDCDWKLELCVPSLDHLDRLTEVLNAISDTGIQIRILLSKQPPEGVKPDVRVWGKDGNQPLEHCFAILDDSTVVTGSFPWNEKSALGENSACVSIKARKVAERFLTEFNRLWEEAGPTSESYSNNARSAVYRVDKNSNIYFFPDWESSSKVVKHDTAMTLLTKSLKKSAKSVKIALPNLHDDTMLETLSTLPVPVTMVTRPTSLPRPPFTVYHHPSTLHAFVIIDNIEVICGSFDWTTHSAATKHQNCIVYTTKSVVDSFVKEFDKLCEACPK